MINKLLKERIKEIKKIEQEINELFLELEKIEQDNQKIISKYKIEDTNG